MDVTLDFEESLNKTNASKIDSSLDQEPGEEQSGEEQAGEVASSPEQGNKVDKEQSESSDSCEDEKGDREESEDGDKNESSDEKKQGGDGKVTDDTSSMDVGETDQPSAIQQLSDADRHIDEQAQSDPPLESDAQQPSDETHQSDRGDVQPMDEQTNGDTHEEAVAVVDDTIELTSNQFENDLLGSEKPKVDEMKEVVTQEVVTQEDVPKTAPKKVAGPPPKIHNREYTEPEAGTEKPKIQWNSKLVRNLISTGLLKDLIEVKLTKEDEAVEASITRSRRSRHEMRTTSGETKKRSARRDEEDLDFEPESDNENYGNSEMVDDTRDSGREPTAFPDPPLEPPPRSRKEENRALLITNLIRPFTVLQLKTMLSHCGKVKSIWISTIKSRCYVVFSTLEEAARARESLHGAVWPSTSPKRLIVDYAEDERMYSETDGELIGDSIDIQVIEEQKRKKPKKEKEPAEEKGTMLDDLFKKTVAVPSIYWLPLTEKQAKTRAEERSKAKPRYFIPEPELESEFVKPRAVPRWRTPDRSAPAAGRAAKSPAGGRGRSPPRRSPGRRGDRRRR